MNMVLTSIYRLDAKTVEPFFRSLRLSGSTGPLVVLVAEISEACRALLRRYDATVVDIEYNGLPLSYLSLASKLRQSPKVIYRAYLQGGFWKKDSSRLLINCWRYFCARDYLGKLTRRPQFVLLADVRDVVFQSDPFAYPFEPGLSAASECVRGTIGRSRGNLKWLWEVAGWREMRRLSDRAPICSGTTMADDATMTAYLDLMTQHMRRCYLWGLFDAIDQGLHNYFVHNRMIEPLHVFFNWNGPFLTLDSETIRPENKNRDGYLCNSDGSVVPIVHQYDRIKDLYRDGEPIPACWNFLKNPQ
jgi:hypothetical protein